MARTARAVKGRLTKKQMGDLRRRYAEITRRANEGTIDYDWAMDQLQLIVEANGQPITGEPSLDLIVRVDRSVKLTYPDWVEKVLCPELECVGPETYDLRRDVELWLHPDQQNGVATGNTIYAYLKETDGLASCLNLQDGLAIQQMGIAVFRKLFKGKAVFLWGSVAQSRRGHLSVPALYERAGRVVVDWRWLDGYWISSDPALRFRK